MFKKLKKKFNTFGSLLRDGDWYGITNRFLKYAPDFLLGTDRVEFMRKRCYNRQAH